MSRPIKEKLELLKNIIEFIESSKEPIISNPVEYYIWEGIKDLDVAEQCL